MKHNKDTITIPIDTYNKLLSQLRSCKNLMIDDLHDDDEKYDQACTCDWCRVIKSTINLLKSLKAN